LLKLVVARPSMMLSVFAQPSATSKAEAVPFLLRALCSFAPSSSRVKWPAGATRALLSEHLTPFASHSLIHTPFYAARVAQLLLSLLSQPEGDPQKPATPDIQSSLVEQSLRALCKTTADALTDLEPLQLHASWIKREPAKKAKESEAAEAQPDKEKEKEKEKENEKEKAAAKPAEEVRQTQVIGDSVLQLQGSTEYTGSNLDPRNE
jgi:hypothetical protein